MKAMFHFLLENGEYLADYHVVVFRGMRPFCLVGGYKHFG